MKSLVRNTIALIMAALVFVTTSGFNVFHHSCNTQKTSEISFIIPSFECEHLEESQNTCTSCCGAEELPPENTPDNDPCCETETLLVKLDLKFEIKQYQKLNKLNAPEFVVGQETHIESFHTETDHIITFNDLPPPLGGKTLKIYLHQLNIPA